MSAVLLSLEDGESGAAKVVLRPRGDSQLAPHGLGNIYAPEIRVSGRRWQMWFGGQGRDGHDRIHLAESRDGLSWEHRGVVLEDPSAHHLNDPSVVEFEGRLWMFLTRAEVSVRDEIAVATSRDGERWTSVETVLEPSPSAGAWDSLLVGRPSVLLEGGVLKMWYDGRADLPLGAPDPNAPKSASSRRYVGYAESRDGREWRRLSKEPVFGDDAGGVHVVRVERIYVMVYESREGARWATSLDGRHWTARGGLTRTSGDLDRFGHVTPFLLPPAEGREGAVVVGAAAAESWDRNLIARVPLGASIEARLRALERASPLSRELDPASR